MGLFQVRRRLDSWLQRTLEELQRKRKNIIAQAPAELGPETESAFGQKQQRIIEDMSNFQMKYQEQFAIMWDKQCSPLINHSSYLLWIAASMAVCLTTFMFWIYCAN